MPARVRTARCSFDTPVYSTGMSQPANGTIFAPEARWRALSGVFLSGASAACSIGDLGVTGTGNGTMRVRARSRKLSGILHRDGRLLPPRRRARRVSGHLMAVAVAVRVAQIRLQRVVTDAEDAAGVALVAVAAHQDQPRVAARPGPHRVVPLERRPERRAEIAADRRRQI